MLCENCGRWIMGHETAYGIRLDRKFSFICHPCTSTREIIMLIHEQARESRNKRDNATQAKCVPSSEVNTKIKLS